MLHHEQGGGLKEQRPRSGALARRLAHDDVAAQSDHDGVFPCGERDDDVRPFAERLLDAVQFRSANSVTNRTACRICRRGNVGVEFEVNLAPSKPLERDGRILVNIKFETALLRRSIEVRAIGGMGKG